MEFLVFCIMMLHIDVFQGMISVLLGLVHSPGTGNIGWDLGITTNYDILSSGLRFWRWGNMNITVFCSNALCSIVDRHQ
jgi:hypothetical protein